MATRSANSPANKRTKSGRPDKRTAKGSCRTYSQRQASKKRRK